MRWSRSRPNGLERYPAARDEAGGSLSLRPLIEELARRFPELEDPAGAIAGGIVLVEGVPVTNPASRVGPESSIVVRGERPMRGLLKLRAALAAFPLPVEGRVALDSGAAAGGFVQGWLEAGAAKVYGVEVGHGQLLGSLRQDPRVVNLERVNIGDLTTDLIPDIVELVSLDLGYLALSVGIDCLNRIRLSPTAHLLALVKPMTELGMGELPTDRASLDRAVQVAWKGIEAAGWTCAGSIESPIRGSKGAIEFFIHAARERG